MMDSSKFIKYNKLVILILIAAILGIGIFFSSGVFFLIVLFSGFIFYISRRHKKRVVCIFLLAIILRVIFSFLHVFIGYSIGVGSDLMGDSVGYSGGGAYIAEVLTNKRIEKSLIADELANLTRFRDTYKGSLPKFTDWRVRGHAYYLGIIYAVFGFSPVTVKLINSLLFIITVYILYRYLLKYFGEQTSFFFLVFSLFLPSLFIWSISGLKEPLISFLCVTGIFSFWHLIESAKLWGIVLTEVIILNVPFLSITIWPALKSIPAFGHPLLFFAGLVVLLLFIKNKSAFIKIIVCALIIFFSAISLNSLRPLSSKIFYYILQISSLLYLFLYLYSSRLFKVGIVLLMIFFIITFPLKEKVFNTYKRFSYMSICKSMVCQYDATTRYQIYPERYNNDARMKRIGFSEFHEPSMSEFIIMSAKGFGYAIFAPLPWQVRSKPELFASLEGYFMIISFLWVINGLLLCFRKVRYPFVSLPIIIPFFILLVLLTFFEGNVGTLLRHRTIMLPFYCALLAIGIGIGRKSYKVVL